MTVPNTITGVIPTLKWKTVCIKIRNSKPRETEGDRSLLDPFDERLWRENPGVGTTHDAS